MELGFRRYDTCLEAVLSNGLNLNFIQEQTPEICLTVVKQNGLALKYVKEQTSEICLEAVKIFGASLQFVKEQTPEICLEAVKQNGVALQFVKEQTPEICLEAVKQNGISIFCVKNQTLEMCLEAVKQDGKNLCYVKDPTLEICLEAVRQNYGAMLYIPVELKDEVNLSLESIVLTELPQTINIEELEDPISLDKPIRGEVYGFIITSGVWRLAISYKIATKFKLENFRESTNQQIFLPLLNQLYPFDQIKWVRL